MNHRLSRICLQISLALLPASGVLAAETAYDVAQAAGHKKDAGIPQLDPTWFASQLFWLAITFVTLYVVFSKKVLPEFSKTIDSRNERIQGDLEEAQKLKEEAEKVHEAYEEILDGARVKSSDLFLKTEENIKGKSANTMDNFRERSLSQSQETEGKVEKAKKAAMKDMDVIAAEIASQAAEKIVGISTDLDQAKSVIKNINKKAA